MNYQASPTKRPRRRKEDIDAIRSAMCGLLEAEHPMTVRQCFYRLVSAGVVRKTEQDYNSTVCRLLTEMRRAGVIPYHWIADNTRWQRKPVTHSGLAAALARTAETYRRALWENQAAYVEVWLEKDALAGVVLQETAPYDVPLMVTRGYPSVSFLYEAAESMREIGKPCYLYYLGDHDPSGVDIPRNVEERLREMAPQAEIHFRRLAVDPYHVELWNLPTRPTKRTDTRAKTFKGESVEVDAIEPAKLRALVRYAIEQHIDQGELQRLRLIEEREREALAMIAERFAA